ncbi:MAG: hypothetical protein LBK95_01290, partial [Bifidobacteriaceae bacterium]|nr:hypothetical protein [Bifidobacteriaceae bacterium]
MVDAPPPVRAAGGPRAAAPGYAVGPARHLQTAAISVPAHEPGPPARHRARLAAAIEAVVGELEQARVASLRGAGAGDAAIFDAHILMLRDPDIQSKAEALIDSGQGACAAWSGAMASVRSQFESLADPYLRARAVDVRGLSDRVARHLLGLGPATVSGQGILVAKDLDPGEAAGLDQNKVTGIVLAEGSPTSHAAILARSLGIAMVTGAGPGALRIAEGTPLALDGSAGMLAVNPDDAT